MPALSITAASVVSAGGIKTSGISAATIAAGNAVYRTSTGTWALADASAAATSSTASAVGIALNGASAGQPLDIQTDGPLTLGTGTEGVIYCVGPTAGEVIPSTDLATTNFVYILGVGQNGGGGIEMGRSSKLGQVA